MQEHTDRRRFLTGIGALTASAVLAGCTGVLSGTTESADITYGDTVDGAITEDGPRDPKYDDRCATHAFAGAEGDIVEITMSADTLDPFLVLTGPDGNDPVAEDDDGASGLNSEILAELPGDGLYTIWAGSSSGDATGSYTLSLARA
jgi:hypothetical protein